jgi:2-hydroxychromene-2-carboxylate isomerase
MAFTVDLYWSFSSPYSYLAVKQLAALRRRCAFDITPRIVLPTALREPRLYAEVMTDAWIDYLRVDAPRIADMLGLPYAMPNPRPVAMVPGERTPAHDQPHIWRLSRLGVAAAEMGRGLPFIDEVASLMWSGRDWTSPEALPDAAARAGLDLDELERAVARAPDRFDAALEANATALREAGHWGVPTMVFEGEPFFGQDRIPVLLWRLRQRGMAERS